MARRRHNKILSSPHFNEIHARLCEGESARGVSKWLKDTYDEKISHAALNTYNNECIDMEDKVKAEVNRRLETEANNAVIETPIVQEKATQKVEAEIKTRTIATETADVLEGMASVGKQFPELFEEMKVDAKKEDSKVTMSDVAKIALQSGKGYTDYFKNQDTNVEVNVNNLTASFNKDKIRSIVDAKRERDRDK